MKTYKEKDIVQAQVTGVQKYGAFVTIDENYTGLIHISQISYGYIKSINDFINVGDKIYVEIVGINKDTNQLKLSIRDINYKWDGSRLKRMPETESGFDPLKENLETWISEKIKEITDKM